MKHQKGAALVVVLSMLTMSLMFGLSSMQSSLVEERLAGNYKAATEAYMAAETGISFVNDPGNRTSDPCSISGFESWKKIKEHSLNEVEYSACYDVSGDKINVISEGSSGGSVRGALRYVSAVIEESSGVRSPYLGMVTCEGGTFSGSGVFDSYDSREAPYSSSSDFGNDAILVSLRENSDIVLSAGWGGGVKGDLFSAGNINFTNTQKVLGSIYAGGVVQFNNWGEVVGGDVISEKEVLFNTGSVVGGDVSANDRVYIKGGWGEGASVEGNVVSPALDIPESEVEDRIGGSFLKESPNFSFDKIIQSVAKEQDHSIKVYGENEDCPGYNVANKFNMYVNAVAEENNNGDYSYNYGDSVFDITDSELGLNYSSSGSSGENVFHFSSFSLNGKGVRVEEPTVLVVDGDVNLGSWGKIFIAEGASLEIYTSGRFLSSGSSSVDIGDGGSFLETEDGVRPKFSVYSTYDDAGTSCDSNSWSNDCGVSISGDADLYGMIVAPYSNVTMQGSGQLFGSINSRKLTIPGGASIHQDIAYRGVGTGDDGNGGGSSSGGFNYFGECLEKDPVNCF